MSKRHLKRQKAAILERQTPGTRTLTPFAAVINAALL
jgi:hypothetical protein